jgi:hypothetical protein
MSKLKSQQGDVGWKTRSERDRLQKPFAIRVTEMIGIGLDMRESSIELGLL